MLDEISVETLDPVFLEWINRLDRYVAANRKYLE
jgi:hypothetical protein